MKIHVLFFGATASFGAGRELEVPINDHTSAADVLATLAASHPALKTRKLLFAINEEYVAPDASLNDGDRLAIFTPVSGG